MKFAVITDIHGNSPAIKGHHILHNYRSNSRVYFNPGALGCNDKPLARCEKLKFYLELEVPEREFILKIFHGGQL